jgi:hypothetical protein
MKNAYTEEEIMFHMSILKIRDVLLKRERVTLFFTMPITAVHKLIVLTILFRGLIQSTKSMNIAIPQIIINLQYMLRWASNFVYN